MWVCVVDMVCILIKLLFKLLHLMASEIALWDDDEKFENAFNMDF